jgi:DNA primase
MPSLVERVLSKLGVAVTVRGKKGMAPCPFHAERTPGAFMIYVGGDRAGGFRCLSCGEHGGLVEFVKRMRDCSADGAREWVEALRQAGDEEVGPTFEDVRLVVDPLERRAFRLPREVVLGALPSWAETPRFYAERRHLTPDQVARWGLGYAVEGRLAGRLVIPVRDREGAARSYHARTFAGHDQRYFYPSGREHPDLDCMFGEQHWPSPASYARGSIIACEGALNALAVERALGPRWMSNVSVAALGGSDPRPMHVAKLASFTDVAVLTDEDEAGEGAADVLVRQLGGHVRVKRVTLGGGRDADDVARDELREAIWRACR